MWYLTTRAHISAGLFQMTKQAQESTATWLVWSQDSNSGSSGSKAPCPFGMRLESGNDTLASPWSFGRQYHQQLSTWAPDSICLGFNIGSIALHPGVFDLGSCVYTVPQFPHIYKTPHGVTVRVNCIILQCLE